MLVRKRFFGEAGLTAASTEPLFVLMLSRFVCFDAISLSTLFTFRRLPVFTGLFVSCCRFPVLDFPPFGSARRAAHSNTGEAKAAAAVWNKGVQDLSDT